MPSQQQPKDYNSCIISFIGGYSVMFAVIIVFVNIQYYEEATYKPLKIIGIFFSILEVIIGVCFTLSAMQEKDKQLRPWIIYNSMVVLIVIGMIIYVYSVEEEGDPDSLKILLFVILVTLTITVIVVNRERNILSKVNEERRQRRANQSVILIEGENENINLNANQRNVITIIHETNNETQRNLISNENQLRIPAPTAPVDFEIDEIPNFVQNQRQTQIQDHPPSYDSTVEYCNQPPSYDSTKQKNETINNVGNYGWNP